MMKDGTIIEEDEAKGEEDTEDTEDTENAEDDEDEEDEGSGGGRPQNSDVRA